MVAVFLPVLPVGVVLWLSSRDVTRSSYVAFGTKKTKGGAGAGVRYVTLCPTLACTTPQAMECDDALSHDLDLRCSNQHYKGLGTSYNNRIVKMKEGGGGHNIGDVF